MTREEALERLKPLDHDGDYEDSHEEADEIISEFVRSLGYPDVADAYDNVGKWFA